MDSTDKVATIGLCGVFATVITIALSIVYSVASTPEALRAMKSCIGDYASESVRIDCARAIYGTADVEVAR